MNLYEMTTEAKILLETLTMQSDDISPDELEQVITDTMAAIGAEDKLDSYGKVIAELKARAEAVKKEKQRLADYQSFLENNIKRMQTAIIGYMDAVEQTKIATDLFRFNIRETDAVEITDENAIPEEFVKWERKINKADIKASIKADMIIPGAALTTNRSVTIK